MFADAFEWMRAVGRRSASRGSPWPLEFGADCLYRRLSLSQGNAVLLDIVVGLVAGSAGFALGRRLSAPAQLDDEPETEGNPEVVVAQQQAELEQMRRSLQAANNDLERFAYIATHDLRAPLRAVDNLTSFLIEDIGGSVPDESLEHLQMIQARVGRLDQMLVSLLEYSRVAREFEPSATLSVHRLLDDATGLYLKSDTSVSIKGADIDFPLPPGLFSQVLGHVLNNAEKHSQRDDVQITIECGLVGDALELRVSDNGPGIEPKFHDKVFELFSTLQPRDAVEGSGLGLAILAKAMRSIGGSVTIESDSEQGAGATFVLTWPRRQ